MERVLTVLKSLRSHQNISYSQKKNKLPLHRSLVQDMWELQEQNYMVFIPKMTILMYCYQSVYKTQSAELFPRLVKKHEINKGESTKNELPLKVKNIHPVLKCAQVQ